MTETPPRDGATTIDRWVESLSEGLNPILVKETRQALKSKQFTAWFGLLLLASWIVTIGGVATIGPSVYYVHAGDLMLYAYYCVLALPLTVVVPFSAYRSLFAEQEENTRDLLEVSTLSPRQIINGKLGSAALQAVIYLSALAPCIAFTYLLRGVDLTIVALLLVYSVLISVGLSAAGLLLAATTSRKYSQVVLSVGFVGLLFLMLYLQLYLSWWLLFNSADLLQENFFWNFNGWLLGVYAGVLAIVYLGAAGLTTFSSANRSTPIRLALVALQAVLIGWFVDTLSRIGFSDQGFLMMTTVVGYVFWGLAGSVLIGEMPVLSHRVRRTLPQSFAGRLVFTWLNPGPASGYMFAVSNATLLMLLGLLVLHLAGGIFSTAGSFSNVRVAQLLLICWAYLVFYLGASRLAIAALRRLAPLSLLGCSLVTFLTVLGGSGIPYVIQSMSDRIRGLEYTYWQLTNPVWTFFKFGEGALSPDQEQNVLLATCSAAGCVLLVNLQRAARETLQLRVARPQRVVEDDLAQQQHEALTRPTNPWGDTQLGGEAAAEPSGGAS
ncbi:hypothetical protein Mal64_03080 [Pseudobythopirellula maris]|uniref:ABC-2 family transporter protein n=1 Tax=Pseudobythopirellula maris TaxID=2527991 RepID=A0A5C5ZRQ7_9BACT|nr:hypothetical protein [Pseudobythopirellula maris]TWT89926.1 hypothetical protein Mal64_03080 [Pseudobythopirellula maris]